MTKNIEVIDRRESALINDEFIRYRVLSQIIADSDVAALDYYLSKGYDLNPRHSNLKTPAFMLVDSTIEFIELIVSKGLNLFIMDSKGNTLLHEAVCSENEDLIKYLLSLGLNPYQENFNKEDSYHKLVFNFAIPQRVLTENTQHTSSISYDDALSNKNYPLALTIIQRDLEWMGGFKYLFKYSYRGSVQSVVKKIYQAFILNNMFAEANTLMNALVDFTSDAGLSITEDFSFTIEGALLTGDKDSIIRVLEANLLTTKGHAFHLSNVYAYLVSHLLEANDEIFKSKMQKVIDETLETTHYYAYNFVSIIMCISQFEFENKMKEFEAVAFDSDVVVQLRVKYLSLMGLIYLVKEDYVNAEYMFNQLKTLVESKNRFEFYEYAQSHAMIEFINRK